MRQVQVDPGRLEPVAAVRERRGARLARAEQLLQDRRSAQRHHGHIRFRGGLAAGLGGEVRRRRQERVRVLSERYAARRPLGQRCCALKSEFMIVSV